MEFDELLNEMAKEIDEEIARLMVYGISSLPCSNPLNLD